jgi:hypothetical protein
MTTPPVDPRLARAEAALKDPRLARFGVVFLSRAGLGLLIAFAVGTAILLVQLVPDPRIGGLPLVALAGVAAAVVALGVVIHPRIRRAAEDRTERWLHDLAAPASPADTTEDGDR